MLRVRVRACVRACVPFSHPRNALGSLFPECFSEQPPVAAITYEWRLSFRDILSYLNPAQARLPALPRALSRAPRA